MSLLGTADSVQAARRCSLVSVRIAGACSRILSPRSLELQTRTEGPCLTGSAGAGIVWRPQQCLIVTPPGPLPQVVSRGSSLNGSSLPTPAPEQPAASADPLPQVSAVTQQGSLFVSRSSVVCIAVKLARASSPCQDLSGTKEDLWQRERDRLRTCRRGWCLRPGWRLRGAGGPLSSRQPCRTGSAAPSTQCQGAGSTRRVPCLL